MSEQELIAGILAGGNAQKKALNYLYKQGTFKESLTAFIYSQNGTKEDSDDIFQEALYTLYKNIREKKFSGNSSIKTYFLGICKNIWLNRKMKEQRRKKIKEKIDPLQMPHVSSPETPYLFREKITILEKFIEKIGATCKKLLSLFWAGYSLEEIAKKISYKNARGVSAKKVECNNKLKLLFLKHPDMAKYFLYGNE